MGVKFTTASNAALIVASYPAITALLELLIYKVKLTGSKIVGLTLAITGIYLLSYVDGRYIRKKSSGWKSNINNNGDYMVIL